MKPVVLTTKDFSLKRTLADPTKIKSDIQYGYKEVNMLAWGRSISVDMKYRV